MLKRLAIVPFEGVIAALLILSGVFGLMHFGLIDPVTALLPQWESVLLNWLAILSGVFMFSGIATGVGRVEQAGLWVLNGVILSRFLLYGKYLGYGETFAQTGVFDATVVVASIVRMHSIKKRYVLMRVKDQSEL